MDHDLRDYPRIGVYVNVEFVLVVNGHNLVQVKDEELDDAKDRRDEHQKGQHLVIHFILVLPEHLWIPSQRTGQSPLLFICHAVKLPRSRRGLFCVLSSRICSANLQAVFSDGHSVV